MSLIKDLNGNHVVQRCLQRLGPEDSQFIYDAAVACCVEVATHRHGCCVLQRCIDFATPGQKQALVMEVARHALVLSQVSRTGLRVAPSVPCRAVPCTMRPCSCGGCLEGEAAYGTEFYRKRRTGFSGHATKRAAATSLSPEMGSSPHAG